MTMIWEHRLKLVVDLIIGMAMALPQGIIDPVLFQSKASMLTSNCLKYALKTKSSKGFKGPEPWPSIVWFLNGLPKSAMGKWF
jgi:hypothetical protein